MDSNLVFRAMTTLRLQLRLLSGGKVHFVQADFDWDVVRPMTAMDRHHLFDQAIRELEERLQNQMIRHAAPVPDKPSYAPSYDSGVEKVK